MRIVSRLCISADGDGKEAALMGRTTFEPALSAGRWPWPNLDVFVLASRRPPGTPEHVVTDENPVRLLERIRESNRGGDVHLVCGPRTVDLDTSLTLVSTRAIPGGAVEIRYSCA